MIILYNNVFYKGYYNLFNGVENNSVKNDVENNSVKNISV